MTIKWIVSVVKEWIARLDRWVNPPVGFPRCPSCDGNIFGEPVRNGRVICPHCGKGYPSWMVK